MGPAVLVIASVVNVPLFLICIFLLQTKFRPQMQEDLYYSKYLEFQQETRKVRRPFEQAVELRELMIASQARLT